LMVFNGAIDHIIQNNPKAKQNPRGLSQLDGYKRGLVNSLTGNLQSSASPRPIAVPPQAGFEMRTMGPVGAAVVPAGSSVTAKFSTG
jgi:hypothetical protein